jgi:hypothetical protein
MCTNSDVNIVTLFKHDTHAVIAALCKDGAAVQRDAAEVVAAPRHQHIADVAEHDNATVVGISDDELVEGRARDTPGTLEHANTDVADELAVDAEHAHATVAPLDDCDATVA